MPPHFGSSFPFPWLPEIDRPCSFSQDGEPARFQISGIIRPSVTKDLMPLLVLAAGMVRVI